MPKKDKFSLADSPLDTSFCYNLQACLLKRFNNYRRNRKQLLSEVFLPSAFMIFGIWLANIDFTFRSPSLLYTPESFPVPQKILINKDMVNADASNIETADII
jgi:hypothetical protein